MTYCHCKFTYWYVRFCENLWYRKLNSKFGQAEQERRSAMVFIHLWIHRAAAQDWSSTSATGNESKLDSSSVSIVTVGSTGSKGETMPKGVMKSWCKRIQSRGWGLVWEVWLHPGTGVGGGVPVLCGGARRLSTGGKRELDGRYWLQCFVSKSSCTEIEIIVVVVKALVGIKVQIRTSN